MKSKKSSGKLRRWAARLSAGTAILVVVFIAAAFRPVDRDDWAESESLMSARDIVATIPGELAGAKPSKLSAGWAAVPLSVKVGEPLAGYAAREGAPSTGKGEKLWARALCLRTETSEVIFCYGGHSPRPRWRCRCDRRDLFPSRRRGRVSLLHRNPYPLWTGRLGAQYH